MAHDESKKSFRDTLNLPRTDFPIRPNHAVDDALMLDRWQESNLYRATFDRNEGKEKYILHDGPPYANGHLHLGHAYNKILKDIVCKSQRMAGYHVPVTPGWDCHGLPIEFKVVQENPGLSGVELKRACREYADKWINVQRNEFKALGILMDWDRPYTTMSPYYEAMAVRAFGVLVGREFIERKNKTIAWCPHDQTVLASAEIEYKDRKDPSIYVLFSLSEGSAHDLFPEIKHGPISLALWTTTPWTLPLNQAVLVKPEAPYVLLEIDGALVIMGAYVADLVCTLLGVEKKVHREFTSEYLTNLEVNHPFLNRGVPVIFDDSVGIHEGTAFVHCAPGAGPVDYEVGVKNHLPIYSPIAPDGKYTQDIEPKELAGMAIDQAQGWVIRKLAEVHKLLYKTTITHSYPHCWRCHNGLIFRATPQWFFNLERQHIKQHALQAIDTIEFIPESGRNFLKATVENRWEWCLSRQRTWGIPIPALLCNYCDHTYSTPDLIAKVADGIAQQGIEFWDKVTVEDLVSPSVVCLNCKGANFRKEQDILDVWFDSGVSHYVVLHNNPVLSFPADIYLEGVDQHRGWFQSSLLTSLVLESQACTKAIMTHGYTVDAKGQKMSKSLGNVVSPQEIIDKLGTDGLRLWVSSIGNTSDPVASDTLLKNIGEVYRKIRNTCRFLLSNLYDFNIESDQISSEHLLPIDHYSMSQLRELNTMLIDEYYNKDFTVVFHKLADYCSTQLSSFYLDIVKDRLYVERSKSLERRSAQTALWYVLDTVTRLMAPILSFTAEHISDYYQKDKKASIHLQPFTDPYTLAKLSKLQVEPLWPGIVRASRGMASYITYDTEQQHRQSWYDQQWALLKEIRSVILKAIELEREKGLIKHSLEAHVTLYIDMNSEDYQSLPGIFDLFKAQGQSGIAFFKEFLIVSQVTLATSSEGLNPSSAKDIYVNVTHAQGAKCPRCWQWQVTSNPDNLCPRCQLVLGV
jgi:isoleucyl-tRNA synthetase